MIALLRPAEHGKTYRSHEPVKTIPLRPGFQKLIEIDPGLKLQPSFEGMSVYSPEGRLIRKSPELFDLAAPTCPRDSIPTVTVTPGMGFPVLSRTMPPTG